MAFGDLVALLNRRVYADALKESWARRFVEAATEALARLDLLGLRRMGCPADEYEPEAVLLVAKLVGLSSREELWASSERPLPALVAAEMRMACAAAFEELFGAGYGEAVEEAAAAELTAALVEAARGS